MPHPSFYRVTPSYFRQKLAYPLPVKGGPTLRTIKCLYEFMFALPDGHVGSDADIGPVHVPFSSAITPRQVVGSDSILERPFWRPLRREWVALRKRSGQLRRGRAFTFSPNVSVTAGHQYVAFLSVDGIVSTGQTDMPAITSSGATLFLNGFTYFNVGVPGQTPFGTASRFTAVAFGFVNSSQSL
jgi:hypothetical protein